MKNKRGISGIIVTLILILLALVAAGTIWYIVHNLVKNGSENISLGSLTLDLRIKSVQKSGSDIPVTVIRNPGTGELTGINFIISNGTDSETIRENANLSELQTESFTLTPQHISIASTTEVSIAPVYIDRSGKEKVGGPTDTYSFISGTSGSSNGDTSGNGSTSGDTSGTSGQTCYTSLDCSTLGYSCGIWPDNCGSTFTCGNAGSCVDSNLICATGICETNFVSSGTIDSVWPSEAEKFFDSSNLPTDSTIISSYRGKYASFMRGNQVVDSRCFEIVSAEYILDYGKSHLELDLAADIQAGDKYSIWNSPQCGNA